MLSTPLERQLYARLLEIPEIAGSGFAVREGLSGSGVTILNGRLYFGRWSENGSKLTLASAVGGEAHFSVASVDEAVRHTLLLILKNLQVSRSVPAVQALAS